MNFETVELNTLAAMAQTHGADSPSGRAYVKARLLQMCGVGSRVTTDGSRFAIEPVMPAEIAAEQALQTLAQISGESLAASAQAAADPSQGEPEADRGAGDGKGVSSIRIDMGVDALRPPLQPRHPSSRTRIVLVERSSEPIERRAQEPGRSFTQPGKPD